MKLYINPASPFARKCRIVARELAIALEEIPIDPWTDESLRRINPLQKIPVLVLDDGSVLFDSGVICDYLNEYKNGHFFPKESMFRTGSGRWRARVLQTIGDGISDASVALFRETKVPEDKRNADRMTRLTAAIHASLDVLERGAAKFPDNPTIGEVAVGCGLGHLDFRHPHLEWRAERPTLRDWFVKFSEFPSVAATQPANLT
ncbi:MAG TPA: glutathione S-transferase family protein [Rhizomicrobium sp.]|nr:glutathione S-transferase family protein [Rhizomicrobium sp.]